MSTSVWIGKLTDARLEALINVCERVSRYNVTTTTDEPWRSYHLWGAEEGRQFIATRGREDRGGTHWRYLGEADTILPLAQRERERRQQRDDRLARVLYEAWAASATALNGGEATYAFVASYDSLDEDARAHYRRVAKAVADAARDEEGA